MRIHAQNGSSRSTRFYFLLAVARIATGSSVTVSGIQSTCPARSINYITQTLPQQCLTSSWASKPVVHATASTDPTNFQIETSTGVLSVKAPPTGSADSFSTSTTHEGSPAANSVAIPSISGENASQTATPLPQDFEKDESLASPSQENDLDSPLDNSKFLSFEEWKLQNLAKAGQSAESLGKRHEGDAPEQRRGRPSGINNALEAFGEDSEIDIDFSGFVNAGGMNEALPIQSSLPVGSTGGGETRPPQEGNAEEDLSNKHKQNKDAGKTCKERSNYASFDCAATVLKTNPECKSATSVLVESKDSYMLNVCSANNKFFIVELCDDILIDTVVLANFEFFSSMFRTFRVSVSDRYPVKMDRWRELGVFEAQNTRAIQAFLVENPLIWARYLRIELLTHFGAEYYCPLSLLRVHGTTMMEEFNHEVKGVISEDYPEDDETEEISNEAAITISETVATNEESSIRQVSSEQVMEMVSPITSSGEPAGNSPGPLPSSIVDLDSGDVDSSKEDITPYKSSLSRGLEDILSSRIDRIAQCPRVHKSTEAESTSSLSSTKSGEPEASNNVDQKSRAQNDDQRPSEPIGVLTSNASVNGPSPRNSDQPAEEPNHTAVTTNTSSSTMKNKAIGVADANRMPDAVDSGTVLENVVPIASGANSASSQASKENPVAPAKSSNHDSSAAATIAVSSPSAPSPSTPSTATSASIPMKPLSSSTQPPAANPSTQESFFKSVHKRLQQLEANSTLSLQYIEEQSRILRDAFSSVEKRQLSKTSTFLETLNTTVLTELRDFRMQYDQIWQSTVLELSSQREQSAQQVSVLSARMTFLADEIVFQKRIAMVQFMLILLCLGLIVFSRSGRTSTYLELPPLVHNAIKKSSANLARYTYFETPPASPSSSRPPSERLSSSKYGLFHRKSHRRTPSDESDANGGVQSPIIAYSPPSPQSQISHEDREASPSGRSADELEALSVT